MEKRKESPINLDQSLIVADESSNSGLILTINAELRCTMSINILNFKKFKKDLENSKNELKNTPWLIQQSQEDEINMSLQRILEAKSLNVDLLEKTDVLKDSYKSSPHHLTQINNLIGSGYTFMRRCLGDGNCYYRAVYYSYFEILIKKGSHFLFIFIKLLKERSNNSVMKKIHNDTMFEILITILQQIYEKLISSPFGLKKALQHLYQSTLLIPEFDLAAVQLLREFLFQFLVDNKFKKLNDLPLQEAVIGDADSFEEYNEKIVRKMGEEARSLLLPILPLILQIKLNTIVIPPISQKIDIYIEACKAEMPEYESFFPKELIFKEEAITLLLKPGHYDIMYKQKNDDEYEYDKGFKDFVVLVFENSEKAKEKLNALNIKDKITTPCCKQDFCKDEYVKSLLKENLNKKNSKTKYVDNYIKCYCGRFIEKAELKDCFSPAEITSLFEQIQNPKEEGKKTSGQSCGICQKIIHDNEEEYLCPCSAIYHQTCIQKKSLTKCPLCQLLLENPDANKFKPSCCITPYAGKDEYIEDFLEFNKKKMNKGEKISEDMMFCPLCDKKVTKKDLEKDFAINEIKEKILAILFPQKCSECSANLDDPAKVIQNSCGHLYHVYCAGFILKDSYKTKTCSSQGCRNSLKDLAANYQKYMDAMSKLCMNCLQPGERLGIFECGHFLCLACGELFRSNNQGLLTHGKTYINGTCNICSEDKQMTKIMLSCKHMQPVEKMKNQFESFKKYVDSGKASSGIEITIPVCYDCFQSINDVEIFLLAGHSEGDIILKKVEQSFNVQKESYTNSGKKQKEHKEDKKTEAQHQWKFIIKECTRCTRIQEGLHRFCCLDSFQCKNCILTVTLPKMEKTTIALLCPNCKMPSNIEFMEFAFSNAKTVSQRNKISKWLNDNTIKGICCSGKFSIKSDKDEYYCTGCKKYKNTH